MSPYAKVPFCVDTTPQEDYEDYIPLSVCPPSIFGFSGTTSLVYCRQMAGIARRKGKIGKGVSQPLSDVTLSVCFPGLEVWGSLGIKSTVFSTRSYPGQTFRHNRIAQA